MSHFRIGVISDTHGFFHPRIPEIFEGVGLIIHGGDVGGDDILERLEEIARSGPFRATSMAGRTRAVPTDGKSRPPSAGSA